MLSDPELPDVVVLIFFPLTFVAVFVSFFCHLSLNLLAQGMNTPSSFRLGASDGSPYLCPPLS